MADTATSEIIAYDTTTLSELGRFAIGESISGGNRMSISDNGNYLFVTTPSGIREITNPYAVPEPASLILLVFGTMLLTVRKRGPSRIRLTRGR